VWAESELFGTSASRAKMETFPLIHISVPVCEVFFLIVLNILLVK